MDKQAEISRMEAAITKTKADLEKGLFDGCEFEIKSQIYRMISYTEEEIARLKRELLLNT